MKNLKTTLIAVAALSAVTLTSFAQAQAPVATAAQPAPKTVSTTVDTKYGKIKVTDTESATGDVFSCVTPMLPENVNNVELANTLVAIIMSLADKVEHKASLNAFAASIPSLDLGDMGGKTVALNASFPVDANPSIEFAVGNASAAFAPIVTPAGEVKGDVVVTSANGTKTTTAVDVKTTETGVTGTVGGSNVTVATPVAPSTSTSTTSSSTDAVTVPDAQDAIDASNNASNDTVGEGKGVSPEA